MLRITNYNYELTVLKLYIVDKYKIQMFVLDFMGQSDKIYVNLSNIYLIKIYYEIKTGTFYKFLFLINLYLPFYFHHNLKIF